MSRSRQGIPLSSLAASYAVLAAIDVDGAAGWSRKPRVSSLFVVRESEQPHRQGVNEEQEGRSQHNGGSRTASQRLPPDPLLSQRTPHDVCGIRKGEEQPRNDARRVSARPSGYRRVLDAASTARSALRGNSGPGNSVALASPA